jgi:hypothetical protein
VTKNRIPEKQRPHSSEIGIAVNLRKFYARKSCACKNRFVPLTYILFDEMMHDPRMAAFGKLHCGASTLCKWQLWTVRVVGKHLREGRIACVIGLTLI